MQLLSATGLLLLMCAVASQSVILQSSHTEAEPLKTANVSLLCKHSETNSSSDMFAISTMRILKFLNNTKVWRPIVEMREAEGSPRVLINMTFSAVGKLSGLGELNGTEITNYLSVTWKLAEGETLGRYRCDVIGVTENFAVLWEKSAVVDLIKPPFTTARDVYDILTAQKMEIESKLDNQHVEIESSIMKELQESADNQFNESKEWEKQMEQDISDMRDIQLLLLRGFLEYWPEGTYGLPQPRNGCPANIGVTWQSSYRLHHTESTQRNHDNISTTNHFHSNALYRSGTNNFMHYHFCMVRTRSVGPLWPKGSYCILQYTRPCPEGLFEGYIHWDDEDSSPSSSKSGSYFPRGDYNSAYTNIFYCCRSDGPADTPIHLPQTKPFYLHIYGGQCQSVVGMNVTEEFMLFDTDNSNENSNNNNYHPDGEIRPDIKLYFCYYERSHN